MTCDSWISQRAGIVRSEMLRDLARAVEVILTGDEHWENEVIVARIAGASRDGLVIGTPTVHR
jgi:hypothetical protein